MPTHLPILPAHILGPGYLHAMLRRFAWRRPAVFAAPSAGRQTQAQVSIPAVAYWVSDLRQLTHLSFGTSSFRGQLLVAVVRSVTEKPNIGRKYALPAGLTTPLYNVTLTLFEEVPPTP